VRFIACFLIAVSFMLSGCMFKHSSKHPSHKMLTSRLESRGATVAVIGDQILIVMPSALIFKPYTATVMPNAQPTLGMLADYINSYTSMLVNVNVYTSKTCGGTTDLDLSKQQAKSLEKALLIAGLDTRVLHAHGRGSENLVSKATPDWQFNMNYRVEITLEKLYV
jgi:outer membrane protein OmpA-like peptidoglycan-associated protein